MTIKQHVRFAATVTILCASYVMDNPQPQRIYTSLSLLFIAGGVAIFIEIIEYTAKCLGYGKPRKERPVPKGTYHCTLRTGEHVHSYKGYGQTLMMSL
jgi:hypothetical protein